MQAPIHRNYRKKYFPILIVEADTDDQRLFAESITASEPGLDLHCVASADEALAYLDQCLTRKMHLPQLILMNLHLPEADNGWYLLAQIKELYTDMPVIVLSTDSDETTVTRTYDLGASSLIAKPETWAQWKNCFKNLCAYWLNVVTLPSRQ